MISWRDQNLNHERERKEEKTRMNGLKELG
jgi:hypothetical protein